MIDILLRFIFPEVGLIVGGEAFALALGILIIKKGKSAWNTLQNRRYLYFDLLTGIVLILHYYWGGELWYIIVAFIVIAGSIVTHFKRLVQYVLKKKNAFCGNKALFFVNNLKLVLLFGLLFALMPS